MARARLSVIRTPFFFVGKLFLIVRYFVLSALLVLKEVEEKIAYFQVIDMLGCERPRALGTAFRKFRFLRRIPLIFSLSAIISFLAWASLYFETPLKVA